MINMKNLNTAEQAEQFLKDCGFKHLAPLSGIHEYIREKEGDKEYCFQINGADLSNIESFNEIVVFTINGIDTSTTPMYCYIKQYPNFKAMIDGEKHRNIFNDGFKNWNIQ